MIDWQLLLEVRDEYVMRFVGARARTARTHTHTHTELDTHSHTHARPFPPPPPPHTTKKKTPQHNNIEHKEKRGHKKAHV